MKTPSILIIFVLGLAMILPAHSENQAVRPKLDLNGTWEFRMDPKREGETAKWFELTAVFSDKIRVPGCWQAQGFGPQIRNVRHNYQGIAWYRRTFEVPANMAGKRIWLRFQSVCNNGEAYLNGQKIGRIETFITPYEFDVTNLVKPGSLNVLVVKVDSGSTDDIARNNFGLGDPTSTNGYVGMIQFFAKWGGIIGNVELSARPESSLEDIIVRTNLSAKKVQVGFSVRRQKVDQAWSGRAVVQINPVSGNGSGWTAELPVAVSGSDETTDFNVDVAAPDLHPWSPEDPFLYNVTVRLKNGEQISDQLQTRTGFREFGVGDGSGAFVLNGKPYFLRGLGYDSIEPITGTPTPDKQIFIERLQRIKAYGFNCVRFLAHTPIQEFFDAADEVGVLVQTEGEWFIGSVFLMTQPAADLLSAQVPRIIREHRNHPSWYAFSALNEAAFRNAEDAAIKGGYMNSAHRTFKEMDPTRYFLASDGGHGAWPMDIVSAEADRAKAKEAGSTGEPKQVIKSPLADFTYFRRTLSAQEIESLAATEPVSGQSNAFGLKPDAALTADEIAGGKSLRSRAAELLQPDAAPFSLGIWIKPESFSGGDYGTLVSFGAAENGQGFIVSLDGEMGQGNILVGVYNSNILRSEHPLIANQWNHVAVSYDGTKVALFLNGKAAGTVEQKLAIAPSDFAVGSLIALGRHTAEDYRSRPHVWHEFDNTYISPLPDLDKEAKLKGGAITQEHNLLERHRARLGSFGLLEEYSDLRKISIDSYLEYIKQAYEGARSEPDLDGFHWWVISDIPAGFECDVTDLGILDIVYQIDKFPDPKVFAAFNSPAVLLIDADIDSRVLKMGESRTIGVKLSNFADKPITDGRIAWRFEVGGKVIQDGSISGVRAEQGKVAIVGGINIGPFDFDTAQQGELIIGMEPSQGVAENRWKFWTFPAQKKNLKKEGIVNLTGNAEVDKHYGAKGAGQTKAARLVITKKLTRELLTYAEDGGNVILLEEDAQLSALLRPKVMAPTVAPVANASEALSTSLPIPFWPRWIRANMNKVEEHPALSEFPHSRFPDYQLARLFGATVNAMDLSNPLLKGKVRPIIWGLNVESTVTPVPNFPEPKEFFHGGIITELNVGKGKIVHCGLWILDGIRRDLPEASYLLDCLVDYTNKASGDLPVALTRAEAESLFQLE